MDRRTFVRVIGGGVIMSAAMASAGCAQHMSMGRICPKYVTGAGSINRLDSHEIQRLL